MPVVEQQGCAAGCGAIGCCAGVAGVPAERGPAWHRAAGRARLLSWFSLLWMTGEGVLGLVAGATAGSIALVAWALGSVIEGLAAVVVIWRFTGARTLSETAEGHAQKAVAVSFFLLAPYIAVEAVQNLLTGTRADTTVLGIVVTAASLLVMPVLGIVKQRLGRTLDSGATAGEGTQNLLCAAQAGAVLLGLALTSTLGWWWADPVIGLALAAVAIRAGRAAWRGEDCC
jgi:divalent metal cation (Fe/Co/Zn/Cd) transporter